jgi:hypothetical protein
MRKFILALVALVGLGGAWSFAANYTMTQGSGTTFGSVVVGGVNYVQMLLCDLTTPSQCASVSAGGAVKVDGSAVTQPTKGGYAGAQLTHVALSFSSSGNNTAITRAVGTIKVYELELSCASQLTTIIPQDGTSTSLGAKSAVQYIFTPLQTEPIYTTTGTNNFVINLSSAVTCTGFAKYLDN